MICASAQMIFYDRNQSTPFQQSVGFILGNHRIVYNIYINRKRCEGSIYINVVQGNFIIIDTLVQRYINTNYDLY